MEYSNLPDDLPTPIDDGECDHLEGSSLPSTALSLTNGSLLNLETLNDCVLYIYPMTAQPGTALPDGWEQIPGARGCTPQSCSFRDHYKEFKNLGFEVFGLSAQDTIYQNEAKERLHLPFEFISDEGMILATSPGIPTFNVEGLHLYKRTTLVIKNGKIVKCFYPVFPPDKNPDDVINWIKGNR